MRIRVGTSESDISNQQSRNSWLVTVKDHCRYIHIKENVNLDGNVCIFNKLTTLRGRYTTVNKVYAL